MTQDFLYRYEPYVVRVGIGGDPSHPVSVYEIYNEDTEVVEATQSLLPNAIHQAMLAAAKLKELLEAPVDLEWKVAGEDDTDGFDEEE